MALTLTTVTMPSLLTGSVRTLKWPEGSPLMIRYTAFQLAECGWSRSSTVRFATTVSTRFSGTSPTNWNMAGESALQAWADAAVLLLVQCGAVPQQDHGSCLPTPNSAKPPAHVCVTHTYAGTHARVHIHSHTHLGPGTLLAFLRNHSKRPLSAQRTQAAGSWD